MAARPVVGGVTLGTMTAIEGLVAAARTAFGWTDDLQVHPGARGALGQIWRVDTARARYALKHIFDEPPTEASIGVELELTRRAAAVGVRAPASHAGCDGHHLRLLADGRWMRCFDWMDLRPVDRTDPDVAARLGVLLARLHQCAPACSVEPNGGGPLDDWYCTTPPMSAWEAVATLPAGWARRVGALMAGLPQLCAAVTRPDPGRLLLCHRDLHPENVFIDSDGELVVVDWDDLGPAEPGQELTRALFDWWCDSATVDVVSVRAMVSAYCEAGGPGRITGPADFTMLVACRLNFLLTQTQLALAPGIEPGRRAWAEREIDVMLHLMPTPAQLAEVSAVAQVR